MRSKPEQQKGVLLLWWGARTLLGCALKVFGVEAVSEAVSPQLGHEAIDVPLHTRAPARLCRVELRDFTSFRGNTKL